MVVMSLVLLLANSISSCIESLACFRPLKEVSILASSTVRLFTLADTLDSSVTFSSVLVISLISSCRPLSSLAIGLPSSSHL